MALEFRTRDETYKGPRILPRGAKIPEASVFVDCLPPGFHTDPYNPYLVTDRHSHRPRYVIDGRILVYDYLIALAVAIPKGLRHAESKSVQLILNTSIERDGLEILLTHDGREYQGALYPIAEL